MTRERHSCRRQQPTARDVNFEMKSVARASIAPVVATTDHPLRLPESREIQHDHTDDDEDADDDDRPVQDLASCLVEKHDSCVV